MFFDSKDSTSFKVQFHNGVIVHVMWKGGDSDPNLKTGSERAVVWAVYRDQFITDKVGFGMIVIKDAIYNITSDQLVDFMNCCKNYVGHI